MCTTRDMHHAVDVCMQDCMHDPMQMDHEHSAAHGSVASFRNIYGAYIPQYASKCVPLQSV